MQNYQIIPISLKYAESFRQAVGSVAREGRYLAFLDSPSANMTQAFIKENIRDNWPHFIAVAGEKVIAWCDITSQHRPIFAHCGVLGVGVLADYRGKGIGTALIKTALKKAKEVGLTRIQLTVRENNKEAFKLYQRLGFVVEGLHKRAVKIDDGYEDLTSMALWLE